MDNDRPRLDGCDPSDLRDPYPVWTAARAQQATTFWDDTLGFWQITRHADVAAASLNTSALSSEGFFATVKVHPGNEHLLPNGLAMDTPSLATADPPVHTRVRKLCTEPFKPKRVAALEPDIRRIADDLIDDFVADGACELIEQFSVPLSLRVIAQILGMPPDTIDEMRRYSDEMPATVDPTLTQQQQAALFEHYGTFYDFCNAAAQRAREHPGNDLLSDLVAVIDKEGDGAPALSEAELVSVIATLITAGNETTRYFIGNLLLALFQHPDQLGAVRANPALAERAVEEALRYVSSVKGNVRVLKKDITVGDVTLSAGELAQVCWGASGRDPEVFDRPEEFDIFRADVHKHIAFSRGPHVCLGAGVARLESRVALQALLARLPGLRLVREPTRPDGYVASLLVHGPARLDIAWDRKE